MLMMSIRARKQYSLEARTLADLLLPIECATGNVTLGVSTNGDDMPEGTTTFNGIQNNWNGGSLTDVLFLAQRQYTGDGLDFRHRERGLFQFPSVVSGAASSHPRTPYLPARDSGLTRHRRPRQPTPPNAASVTH